MNGIWSKAKPWQIEPTYESLSGPQIHRIDISSKQRDERLVGCVLPRWESAWWAWRWLSWCLVKWTFWSLAQQLAWLHFGKGNFFSGHISDRRITCSPNIRKKPVRIWSPCKNSALQRILQSEQRPFLQRCKSKDKDGAIRENRPLSIHGKWSPIFGAFFHVFVSAYLTSCWEQSGLPLFFSDEQKRLFLFFV